MCLVKPPWGVLNPLCSQHLENALKSHCTIKLFVAPSVYLFHLCAVLPNLKAMRAIHDGAEPKFIKAAVDKAVTMGYAGYNFDNELRGGSSESSWDSLKSFG